MVLIKTLEEKYNISYQNDRTNNTNAEGRIQVSWVAQKHLIRYDTMISILKDVRTIQNI